MLCSPINRVCTVIANTDVKNVLIQKKKKLLFWMVCSILTLQLIATATVVILVIILPIHDITVMFSETYDTAKKLKNVIPILEEVLPELQKDQSHTAVSIQSYSRSTSSNTLQQVPGKR